MTNQTPQGKSNETIAMDCWDKHPVTSITRIKAALDEKDKERDALDARRCDLETKLSEAIGRITTLTKRVERLTEALDDLVGDINEFGPSLEQRFILAFTRHLEKARAALSEPIPRGRE